MVFHPGRVGGSIRLRQRCVRRTRAATGLLGRQRLPLPVHPLRRVECGQPGSLRQLPEGPEVTECGSPMRRLGRPAQLGHRRGPMLHRACRLPTGHPGDHSSRSREERLAYQQAWYLAHRPKIRAAQHANYRRNRTRRIAEANRYQREETVTAGGRLIIPTLPSEWQPLAYALRDLRRVARTQSRKEQGNGTNAS